MMKRIFLFMMLLVPLLAKAQTNRYAQLTPSKTNVFLGEVFTVDVLVKSPSPPPPPSLDSLTDFNVTVLDEGKPTKVPNTYLFRYSFRAKQEGERTIPPLAFTAGDQTIYSSEVAITAQKPLKTERMTLSSTLSKTSGYAGEPLLLTTVWDSTYQFSALKAVDFHFPILNDPRLDLIELHSPDTENDDRTTGLPVQNTRIMAQRNSYKQGEVQHQSISFKKIVVPKKAGRLKIGSSTLLCAAENELDPNSRRGRNSAFQYPAYFDNTFFDQNLEGTNYTRIYTESEPLELEVKPLPATGRPQLFSGLVGQYSLAVHAEPTAVRVGEPITLTITVTAAQFMETILFPPLRYQPLLINRFEIPSERSIPQLSGKAKIYTQTIRPLSTDLTEIPPIELHFFNPESGQYEVAKSSAIPLTVSPSEAVAAYGVNGTLRNRLRAVEEGIRQNYVASDMLKNRRPPLFGWAHPLIVFAILLLPPALFGGLSLVTFFSDRKRHIHRTAKAARAFRVYRRNAGALRHRNLKMKSEIYRELDRVLRAYLGDRLHKRPGAITFKEVDAALEERGAGKTVRDDLKSLFETCEAYRFTDNFDTEGDAKSIFQHADRIVKAVEGVLR